MLENLDKIKDRISSLNNEFKGLKGFSESKSGELFSKMLDFESKNTVAQKTDVKSDETYKDAQAKAAKAMSNDLFTSSLGQSTDSNNNYLQDLLLTSIKGLKK